MRVVIGLLLVVSLCSCTWTIKRPLVTIDMPIGSREVTPDENIKELHAKVNKLFEEYEE